MMADEFGRSLLEATDLEISQRDKYVKSFEHEYKLTHPLEVFVPATNADIGGKALVAHISTVAINLTTAGATATVFYFLELEVLAREFGVSITNPLVMIISTLFAIAAVMGIDFTLTSTGLAKGETDATPYSGNITHWSAGITAATAGIFRGLLYFQIIPPGTQLEIVVKTLVLLAIAVLPVLVLYPAARISGYYMGWVNRENNRRKEECRKLEHEWKNEFQEALKVYISSRVSTANTLQKKIATQKEEIQIRPILQPMVTTTGVSEYVRQAFDALCAEDSGFDPLNIRPSDIIERLESGGIKGIKDGTLRPTIQRVKASMLNNILLDMDISPFQAPDEFCERLSSKFGRVVRPEEISHALLTDMQNKFPNK